MERKIILAVALGLGVLGVYQYATGAIEPNADPVEAQAECLDALARARAIRNGAPLLQSEDIRVYLVQLNDCKDKHYLSATDLGDLAGSLVVTVR